MNTQSEAQKRQETLDSLSDTLNSLGELFAHMTPCGTFTADRLENIAGSCFSMAAEIAGLE